MLSLLASLLLVELDWVHSLVGEGAEMGHNKVSSFSPPVSGCGTPSYSPLTRVVNGVDANPHSWPWQVSLQYLKGEKYDHICGASLISQDWVLTAGHCISKSLSYQVVLGEHDFSVEEGSEQVIPILTEDIFVHPGWNPYCIACGNDVALMKLSQKAQLNDKVQLACLPPAGQILPHDTPCFVSGWGTLYTGGPLPDKLQQAQLPVVDHAHCSHQDWWGNDIKESMICAGGDIRSACNGDSGGPLNCRGSDGRWYIQGIASFVYGEGCNTLKKPTVFTRDSAFVSWIEETMANN
ncbi:proproteinase E-like [Ornithorhynchus anatinus]|uniref:proproteinase E-like n=1 Tax=Ornithorhynchus anatinus TaxID=9258 RepID=UPI0010A7D5FF|nr:proproteinase E-like [Ornithorhynchus anatinus]